MAEKEKVIICDECNKVIAHSKCNLCGKDLCEKCDFEIMIKGESRSSGDYFFSNYVSYCNGCREKIRSYSRSQNSFKELMPKIKGEFVDYVRKAIILNELEKEKK